MSPIGIYLHIPFCSSICNYCNFNRGLLDEGLKRRYVDALVHDIERQGDGVVADTVYFGGGTPSLLDPDEIASVLTACRRAFALAPDTEVTMEANPDTVSLERLTGFRAAGINRLSFGVQSFRDEELRRLGRVHDVARAREAVVAARHVGFDNVSVDLMMWLPEQTVDHWLESVDALIELGPDHASLYLLEIYPNAPLRDEMARGGWEQAPDEVAAEMYERGLERLEEANFEQYEISNIARSGKTSRHNLKYWTDGEWHAFGCGAHGNRNGVRWRNASDTADYVRRVAEGTDAAVERRPLSPAERAADAAFMGLRLTDGVDLASIEDRYGVDVLAAARQSLQPFLEAGLAVHDATRLRLTRRGFLLANEIMAVFV